MMFRTRIAQEVNRMLLLEVMKQEVLTRDEVLDVVDFMNEASNLVWDFIESRRLKAPKRIHERRRTRK